MARLDTGWHANPKVLRLSPAGMALHAWSISYCDFARSDGFIPQDAWPSKLRTGVKELEQTGLYRVTAGGYHLHDYLDYNHSRAEIEDYMRAKQAAGQAGGQASAQARAKRRGQADGSADAQANGKQDLKQKGKQNRTPGPGPGLTTRLPGGRLVGTGVARALEGHDGPIPTEVLARLSQPPIADRPADRPA